MAIQLGIALPVAVFTCLLLNSLALMSPPWQKSSDGEIMRERNITEDHQRVMDYYVHKGIGAGAPSMKRLEQTDHQAGFEHWGQKAFFFTHHKTGTILAKNIAIGMSEIMGKSLTSFAWNHNNSQGCADTHLGNYQNLNKNAFEKIKKQCPDFRAVHIVREARALTVSGYLYHKNSQDTIPGTGPEKLQGLQMWDGLKIEAGAEVAATLPEMYDVHKEAIYHPNVLTVGLEEFDAGFDNVTRRMFKWLLGNQHPKIDKLVEMAAKEDVSRWPETEKDASNHIADEETASQALKTLDKLYRSWNPMVRKVVAYDTLLGYPESVPSS